MIKEYSEYPDYSAEIAEIRKNGITTELVNKIIDKHRLNAAHTKGLYNRYKTMDGYVPIFNRPQRFKDNKATINNRINNDFFSEITDVQVGYFCGKPITYTYSETDESEQKTGGEEAVELASKTLNDFVTRNNMYDRDMEMTKFAATCGYVGRLMYIDEEGMERVKIIPPYETIVLAEGEITEPNYGIRYYKTLDINGFEVVKAEFYDETNIYFYEGTVGAVYPVSENPVRPHRFNYCPLQGIPNNGELMGAAEKQIELIDAYNKVLSDCVNEIEGFAHAYMIFKNINIKEEEMEKAQERGSIAFNDMGGTGDVYFLQKNNNGSFMENALTRIEDNIYRFSRTPKLHDQVFASSSGISLKFKLIGFETRCGMFQAKVQSAATYMFKVLASAWKKKKIQVDPLQCYMTFHRNFPIDMQSEAATATSLLSAGLPKKIVYENLSFIDDVDYVLDLIEEEKDDIEPLFTDSKKDKENEDDEKKDKIDNTGKKLTE